MQLLFVGTKTYDVVFFAFASLLDQIICTGFFNKYFESLLLKFCVWLNSKKYQACPSKLLNSMYYLAFMSTLNIYYLGYYLCHYILHTILGFFNNPL